MRLRDASAAHGYCDRMSTGLTRVGLPSRVIVISCVKVMVPISYWMIVIVCRRAVVVIRVIVLHVLVDVQRRRRGRRHGKGQSQQECDHSAHGSSVLRPAETLRKARRVSQLGEWTG